MPVLATALSLAFAGAAAAGDGDEPAPQPGVAGFVSPSTEGTAGVPAALRSLAFVENLGQWDTQASFVASLGKTVVQVRQGGFVVDACPEGSDEWVRLGFELEGAREGVEPRGEAQLPGVHNYFVGNDPERWRSGAQSFAQVVYPGLHEGVDLRLREGGGMLEYDLHLAPGADLSSVVVRCEGVDSLEIDEEGGLLMQTAQGVLRQTPPRTWCVLPSGEQQPLECAFVVHDAARFGFRLAEHDPDLPVVIDPGLEWATFLGGSANDTILGMARKASGEVVVTGITRSYDFPKIQGPIGPAGGFSDVFVSILDASGSTLKASTLLGGTDQDGALDVEVNAAGEVFVAGWTSSPDFPVTSDAYMPFSLGGSWPTADGWIVQLTSNLGLAYGSYLGGSAEDLAVEIEVREPAIVTVGGVTNSTDFPTTGDGLQTKFGGGPTDYFLCRLDLDQLPTSQLVYGTYLGGSSLEGVLTASHPTELQSLALQEDAAGTVTFAGFTYSADFPTTRDGYSTTRKGLTDTCMVRIDPSQAGGAGLLYGTFLGGSHNEGVMALAVDAAGVVTLGGYTYSTDFPTTSGGFQTTLVGPAGFNDGFILRLDPSQPQQSQLLYATYLGGDGYDPVMDLALDPDGKIVAQGFTGTNPLLVNSFPTTCGAVQPNFTGERDAYVLYLDPAGNGVSDLLYSTFLGGISDDLLGGGLELAATSPTLRVVGAGWNEGVDFPTTPGAYQPTSAGFRDGVVFQLEINPHTYCDAAPNSAGPDGAIICGSGSVSIADNTFTLSVKGATPNDLGLFIYGDAAAQVPLGNGTRCVGGNVYRLLPLIQIDPLGNAGRLLDFTQPPAGSGPGAITPGSTRYFQFWHRDPKGGGATTNLSNGLKATFYP